MNTNTNVQPRFIQVILNVKDGKFDKFFLGRLNAGIEQKQGIGYHLTSEQTARQKQVLSAARQRYEQVNNDPPPLSTVKDYAKLPTGKQDLIKQKSRILERLLANTFPHTFPLITDEVLIGTDVSILMSSWENFDEGTIVYLQETNLAKVAFLLPYLNLDSRDASLRTLRGTYILTTKVQPQASLVYVREQNVAEYSLLLLGTTSVDPGKALLTFATVAAFALPEPFGVLTSGALSVVQMFFGGNKSALADVFQQAMQDLLNSIEQYLAINEIHDAANKIQTSLEWLDTQSQVIKDLGDDANARSFIVNTALPHVSTVDLPNSDLRNSLTTLLNLQLPDNIGDWDLRMKVFDVLTMGVAAYVTFLRVRTQMQAALESDKDYIGGKQLYAFYDDFRLETLTWATKLAQRINDLATERISLVSPLWEGSDGAVCPPGAPGAPGISGECQYLIYTSHFWAFNDNEPGKGDDQHKWNDTANSVNGSCGQVYFKDVQHKDQAEAARNAYIAQLNTDMDHRFANAKGMIQGFQDAIKAWNERMIPRVPQAAPSVEKDLSKWAGSVPQGSWVKGAKVRYAVTFANSAGIGPQGIWGNWTDIGDKAWPLVTDIPTDPLDLTTARHLHRQFQSTDGTVEQSSVVTIIPDNQTKTYEDHNN